MARRIYFHIGVPKSGTTFLQTAMWHNRKRLRKQGFLYPGKKRIDQYRAQQVIRDTPLRRLQGEERAWDDLVTALGRWKGNGLISHEFYSMATPRQIETAMSALAPADVQVVITVRDYVRQFPAVWQEGLKMHFNGSFHEFMKKAFDHELKGAWSWQSQDVPAVLERWSSVVSPDRIHVITVPPPDAPRELLWQRWCEVLEIDGSDFNMDVGYSNESIGAPQAALLHAVKPYLSPELRTGPVAHPWVRGYFGHKVLVPQRGRRFGLRPDDAAQVRELSIEMAETIRKGGYPVTGDLADLIPAEEQPDWPDPDEISESEIIEVAAKAINQMILDMRRVSHQRDEYRAALRAAEGRDRSWRQLSARIADRLPDRIAEPITQRLGRGGGR
jgi:hypothetical protein